jgi:hypothetical protein
MPDELTTLLCGLRAFGFGWFLYSCNVTLYKYHAKIRFYTKFRLAFAIWFLGMPATIGVAHALDPWVRFMIVNAMDYSFLYVSQLALLAGGLLRTSTDV